MEASPEQVVARYAERWAIEVSFQEAKHVLGVGEARSRTEKAVLRTVPFGLLWPEPDDRLAGAQAARLSRTSGGGVSAPPGTGRSASLRSRHARRPAPRDHARAIYARTAAAGRNRGNHSPHTAVSATGRLRLRSSSYLPFSHYPAPGPPGPPARPTLARDPAFEGGRRCGAGRALTSGLRDRSWRSSHVALHHPIHLRRSADSASQEELTD